MYHRGDISVLSAFAEGKPVLICAEGGGNRCVTSVGVLEALTTTGKKAKAHVGVSGGACNLAGFLAGSSEGVFEVYEALTRDRCLSLEFSWPYGWRMQFDREMLIRRLEDVLDTDAIREETAEFWAATLAYKSGDGVLLDAKEDTFAALRATVSLPSLCAPVMFGDRELVDGMRIPITPAIRKFWARHVLILRSRREWWWEDALYPYLAQLSLRDVPPLLRSAVVNADAAFAAELARLRTCTRIKHLEIGPDALDPFLFPWTGDIAMLRSMRMNAHEYTIRLMDEACTN